MAGSALAPFLSEPNWVPADHWLSFSWLRNSPNLHQVIGAIVFVVLVFAVTEWLFARRMGFEMSDTDLVLCGPIRQIRISWSNVEGIRWIKTRRLISRTEFLLLETSQRRPRRIPPDSPIRIPSIANALDSKLPNDHLLGPLLTSNKVRATDGREVDVLDLLEQARAQAASDAIVEA